MKKIILILMLVLSLCGCSDAVPATPQEVAAAYSKDFSARVLTAFGENEAELDVSKNGMSISFLITSPAEAAGMGIELFDEHAVITYGGMEQKINTDELPEETPFLLLEELFEELSDPEEFVLSTENGNLLAKNDDFTAVLSAEDFSLISAEFPRFGTKFTFSDFEFKPAE